MRWCWLCNICKYKGEDITEDFYAYKDKDGEYHAQTPKCRCMVTQFVVDKPLYAEGSGVPEKYCNFFDIKEVNK